MAVVLNNVGADEGTGITGTLIGDPSSCTVTDPVASFPDAEAGGSVQSLPDHFGFTALPSAPHGQPMLFTLDWSADGGYQGSTNVAIPVCHPLIISDIEINTVGNVSARVGWSTNVPATSRVRYGTSTPDQIVDGDGTTTLHSVEIPDLDPCTDYVFAVESTSPGCYVATDDNGGQLFAFTTTAGTPMDMDATDTPLSIPDDNPTGATSTISVDSPYDVLDVDVLLDVTHTYDGDLSIQLIGPDGTTVMLSNRHGGSGQNYISTLFDDEATMSISQGSPPFTGSFQPDQPLATFDGLPAAGDWSLRVEDHAGWDTGTLDSWQLRLELNQPCTDVFADGFESGDCDGWSAMAP
jgi:subtilisin-like proprotein convertase family protein